MNNLLSRMTAVLVISTISACGGPPLQNSLDKAIVMSPPPAPNGPVVTISAAALPGVSECDLSIESSSGDRSSVTIPVEVPTFVPLLPDEYILALICGEYSGTSSITINTGIVNLTMRLAKNGVSLTVILDDGTLPTPAVTWEDRYRDAIQSVGKLLIYGGTEELGHCTAWVIAPGIVATAWHCAAYYRDGNALGIQFPATNSAGPDQRYDARITWATGVFDGLADYDLALVEINTQERLPLAYGIPYTELRITDEVMAIGYLGNLPFKSGEGRIIAFADGADIDPSFPADELLIFTDAMIDSGDSGGPLLDDGGTVIGVNVAGVALSSYLPHWPMSISVPTDYFLGVDFPTADFH